MSSRDESVTKVELEVERNVLSAKVELSDGTTGHIFSRNPHRNETRMFTYNCHICSVPNLPGERCLYTHISGRRHQTKLTMKPFNANLFRAPLQRSNKIVMKIAPGEPVPPGFENEVKAVAEIQSKIDKCKNVPFIGLEYLVELSLHDDKEPAYLCVLCEKRGDPRTIIDHLTSYKHRLKYLVKSSNIQINFHIIHLLPLTFYSSNKILRTVFLLLFQLNIPSEFCILLSSIKPNKTRKKYANNCPDRNV